MGFFSRKKTITVSSSVYNLAGDQDKRIQFLPTAIVSSIIADNNSNFTDVIQNALLTGYGIRFRSFARWARSTGFSSLIGQSTGTLSAGGSIDAAVLAEEIPHSLDETVVIGAALVDTAEYSYWAEEWILNNYPEQVDSDYTLDYDSENNIIYITLEDSTIHAIVPTDLDDAASYIFARYTLRKGDILDPVVEGTFVGGPHPDTAGYTFTDTVGLLVPTTLYETTDVVITYSDSTPEESSTSFTSTSVDASESVATWDGEFFMGAEPEGLSNYWDVNTLLLRTVQQVVSTPIVTVTTEDIAGVIKTTTTTVTTDTLEYAYSHRLDTAKKHTERKSVMKMFIYKFGSGNSTLDGIFTIPVSAGYFFPFIPLRQWNRFISPSYQAGLYLPITKAVKKATNSKHKKLIKQLEDNPSLGDIDFAFLQFGVSINTKEKEARKYLYKYFQTILASSGGGYGEYNAWQSAWNAANLSNQQYAQWVADQKDPLSVGYGSPQPTVLPYPAIPTKSLRIRSSSMSYDMIVSWSAMQETVGVGQGRPNARAGDCWTTLGGTTLYDELLQSGNVTGHVVGAVDYFAIHWQDTADTHRTMGIWGLNHRNTIYKGKAVSTSISKAMADPEESGFIIPLHEGVFRSLALKDATQMASACSYMVINTYEVTKQKWYQTSWFKIVLIIVVIAVTVFTGGAGAGSVGLLGTAAAVGASLGFAGAIGILVGTLANALAAMILTKILTAGATALFGEQFGAIIGTLASIAAISYGTSLQSGSAFNITDLFNPGNLAKLSTAGGDGLSSFLGGAKVDYAAATAAVTSAYNKDSMAIHEMYQSLVGHGGQFNPLQLVGSQTFMQESSNSFLNRTLLTGGDIAEMSNSLTTNFVIMNTSLTLPI